MKIRLAVMICACLFMAACGQEPSPSPQSASTAAVKARATIGANNFTDATWNKGVLVGGDRNAFYFLVDAADASPVKVGDRLHFKKSGEATVTKAVTAAQGSRFAVFVTVDKPLDPDGDGFPNLILVQ